jgi:hypothetical protein
MCCVVWCGVVWLGWVWLAWVEWVVSLSDQALLAAFFPSPYTRHPPPPQTTTTTPPNHQYHHHHQQQQQDLFPPAFSGRPSHTADEWLAGSDKEPKLMSLDPTKRPSASSSSSTPPLFPTGNGHGHGHGSGLPPRPRSVGSGVGKSPTQMQKEVGGGVLELGGGGCWVVVGGGGGCCLLLWWWWWWWWWGHLSVVISYLAFALGRRSLVGHSKCPLNPHRTTRNLPTTTTTTTTTTTNSWTRPWRASPSSRAASRPPDWIFRES